MREQRRTAPAPVVDTAVSTQDQRYEYLTLTVAPKERVADARARVKEHAEYGKWELMGSAVLYGGARRYVMRRRIMRVQRTF